MRRLATVCALALLACTVLAVLQPPGWRLDAGTFSAMWAAFAIAVALTVNAVIARRRKACGPFGPGLPGVVPTFWAAMGVNAAAVAAIAILEERREHVTDSYAMGAGALLPHAIVLVAILACSLFASVRWWPSRLLLATAAGCTAAFACVAATWWI